MSNPVEAVISDPELLSDLMQRPEVIAFFQQHPEVLSDVIRASWKRPGRKPKAPKKVKAIDPLPGQISAWLAASGDEILEEAGQIDRDAFRAQFCKWAGISDANEHSLTVRFGRHLRKVRPEFVSAVYERNNRRRFVYRVLTDEPSVKPQAPVVAKTKGTQREAKREIARKEAAQERAEIDAATKAYQAEKSGYTPKGRREARDEREQARMDIARYNQKVQEEAAKAERDKLLFGDLL